MDHDVSGNVGEFHCFTRALEAIARYVVRKEHVYSTRNGRTQTTALQARIYSSGPLWALLASYVNEEKWDQIPSSTNTYLLTAAARSICPPTAGGFLTPGFGGTDREAPVGRWVVGIGGLPGIFGGPPPPPDTFGFEATGGGPGFGRVAA